MKYAFVLLLMGFNAFAFAQPIYRCEERPGHIAFRDTPCTEQPVDGGADPIQPGEPVIQLPAASRVSNSMPAYWQGDWSQLQRRQPGLQAKFKADALAQRERALWQPSHDRKTAGYLENQRRCKNAMRVAALCGKFAGKFYCDEQGFRPALLTDVNTPTSAVIKHGSQYTMEQCALQVTTES